MKFFLTLLLSVYWSEAVAEEVTYVSRGAAPVCEFQYPEPQITLGGDIVDRPSGALYCLQEHANASLPLPHLLRVFSNFVNDRGQVAIIRVSATFFQDDTFTNFICRLDQTGSIDVEIYVQNEFVGTDHLDDRSLATLADCTSQITVHFVGCDPFTPDGVEVVARCMSDDDPFAARMPNPDSHHTKILAFEFVPDSDGIRSSLVAFGSGNFHLGSLSVNIEDWSILSSEVETSGSFWWECTFGYLAALSASYGDLAAEAYNACRGGEDPVELQYSDGSRSIFFLHPMDANVFLDAFRVEIELAQSVVIVAPSFETRAVRSMIRDNPDTDFIILVDDAFVVAAELNEERNFISPETANELLDYGSATENVEIRFLQTNHNFPFHNYGNTVHARSVVFSRANGETVYLVSSSHFRDGSYFRNTEQSMFVYGQAATEQASFVLDLLSRSITRAEVSVWSPSE